MHHFCLYTNDFDLAESFKIYFEGKYVIEHLQSHDALIQHLSDKQCRCQALIYDAVNLDESDIKFLTQVHEEIPELAVIICYVYFEEKKLSEKLLAAQVQAIIYKPFDFGEVDRQVQKLLSPTPPAEFAAI